MILDQNKSQNVRSPPRVYHQVAKEGEKKKDHGRTKFENKVSFRLPLLVVYLDPFSQSHGGFFPFAYE